MKKVEAYQAEDGTLFVSQNNCLEHERKAVFTGLIDEWIDQQDEGWYHGATIETILNQFVQDRAEVISEAVRFYDTQPNG